MYLANRLDPLRSTALLCVVLLVRGEVPLMAQAQTNAPVGTSATIPAGQLDSMVAPIALYPDPLLAQVLVASTYPLELVQLQQWLAKHTDLKEKALADAVKKEDWDPSIQAMAALPDVVKQMVDNIKWTAELGNAFLAQQSDVMDAVQRMRTKAKDSGKLTSGDQIKVETRVVESKSVVVIEQANPQVVYVPSYDPVVVWGVAPMYAYPPYYAPVGYYAAGMALSFGVGMAMGAMWGGGWGYGSGWGGNNNININNNNNFVNNSNRRNNVGNGNGNIGNGNRGNGNWQHNPKHRGGAPYGDRGTANKFGGTTRGDSMGNRQASARQNVSQRGSGSYGGGDRGGAAGNRGGGAAGNRSGAGGDRVGNRQVSGGGGSGSRGGGAFAGSSGSRSSARSSSSRGSSSYGGGSRGGGGRSGGGGRRR